MREARLAERLSGVDELLREVTRALSKLAQLKSNQRPIVESEAIHIVTGMLGATSDAEGAVSIGVKLEGLELLCHVVDVPVSAARLNTPVVSPSRG